MYEFQHMPLSLIKKLWRSASSERAKKNSFVLAKLHRLFVGCCWGRTRESTSKMILLQASAGMNIGCWLMKLTSCSKQLSSLASRLTYLCACHTIPGYRGAPGIQCDAYCFTVVPKFYVRPGCGTQIAVDSFSLVNLVYRVWSDPGICVALLQIQACIYKLW